MLVNRRFGSIDNASISIGITPATDCDEFGTEVEYVLLNSSLCIDSCKPRGSIFRLE